MELSHSLELEEAYQEANSEIEGDFDSMVGDGLEHDAV